MRASIAQLAQRETPDHPGLAYDVWAPVDSTGKVPDGDRTAWLRDIARLAVPADYAHAYGRWLACVKAESQACRAEVTLAGRLLVGHGNPAGTDVGLTLHHTWGVPIIPGSALKGLLAHYVDAVHGGEEDAGREAWRGVRWDGRSIKEGPGKDYRVLFGAPDADDDDTCIERWLAATATAGAAAGRGDAPYGASQGHIVFHDAWYVPGSGVGGRPLAPDVLTVHQKEYYNSRGGSLPNDYDSPNPVAFLTVAPEAKFLVAVSGPDGWAPLAIELLLQALEEWGVGGKTSAGYGRVAPGARIVCSEPDPTPQTKRFLELLAAFQGSKSELLTAVEEQLPELVKAVPAQRTLIATAVTQRITRRVNNAARLDAVAVALQLGQLPDPPHPVLLAFLADLVAVAATDEGLTQVQDRLLAGELDELSASEKVTAAEAIRNHFAQPVLAAAVEETITLLA